MPVTFRALLGVLVLTTSLVAGCGSDAAPRKSEVDSVWPLPDDPGAAAQQAGLPMLDREMLDVHYHAHIDLVVRGTRIQVPANIGIDVKDKEISPLHTHDATGIVHIESAEDIPFTLGQFFTAWGKQLSATAVGPITLAEGEKVRVYKDGTELDGDPAQVRFTEHAQILIWVSNAPPREVTATYSFPPNL